MSLTVIVPIVAALIAAAGAYFAAVKKLSGTITTSTAEDLWAESRQMRKDLNLRITQLQAQVDAGQKRIDDLTDENNSLIEQLAAVRGQLAAVTRRQDRVDDGGSL